MPSSVSKRYSLSIRDPGQLLPQLRELVAAPRQRFLGLEQLQPGGKPLFTCSGLVVGLFLSFALLMT